MKISSQLNFSFKGNPKLKLVLTFLTASLFSFYSCNKNQEVHESGNLFQSIDDAPKSNLGGGEDFQLIPFSCTSDTSTLNIYNANNPYEYIGLLHNRGLDYATNFIIDSSVHVFTESILSEFIDSLVEQPFVVGALSTVDFGALDIDPIVTSLYEFITDTSGEYLQHTLSAEVSNYVIDSIFDAFNGGDYTPGDYSDAAEIISKLKTLENNLTSNSQFTSTEKQAIFMGLSTAKYSLVYWTCQYNTNSSFRDFIDNHGGGDIQLTNNQNNVSFREDHNWKFFKGYVGADAAGAITGAFTGLIGGPGAALGGAFIGATGNSLGFAVTHWITEHTP